MSEIVIDETNKTITKSKRGMASTTIEWTADELIAKLLSVPVGTKFSHAKILGGVWAYGKAHNLYSPKTKA